MKFVLFLLVCLAVTQCHGKPNRKRERSMTNRVLNALEKAVRFFDEDFEDLNLDGLYGLRVAQGQLIDVIHNIATGGIRVDPVTKNRVAILVEKMEHISEKVISNLKDTDYYNKFKYVVSRPFRSDYNPSRAVEDINTNTSPLQIVEDIHNYDEKFGDRCFEELIGAATIPGTNRFTRTCTIQSKCAKYLLNSRGVFGYRLTHQILFIIFGKTFKCDQKIEQLERRSIEDTMTEMCSKTFMEAMILLNMGAADTNYRDFFMEEVATCGMLGFQDFFRRDWLRKILSWQLRKGCFSMAQTNDKKKGSMRRLLVEKKMEGACLSHESGLGASVLGTYLRYLLDNNGKFRT